MGNLPVITDKYIRGLQVLHVLGPHLSLLSNVNIDKMLLRLLPGQVPGRLVMPLNFIPTILALLSTKLEKNNELLAHCPVEHRSLFFEEVVVSLLNIGRQGEGHLLRGSPSSTIRNHWMWRACGMEVEGSGPP